MPDLDGMVRGAERKAWGILGRPPARLAWAHPDLVRQWKTLAEDARTVMRMRAGPASLARAKDIEARRSQLVRDIAFNVRGRSQ